MKFRLAVEGPAEEGLPPDLLLWGAGDFGEPARGGVGLCGIHGGHIMSGWGCVVSTQVQCDH